MSASLLTYASVTFFLVVTPGITTTVVIERAIRSGMRAGIAAAVGAALANSTHGLLAGLGLSVIIRRWPHGLTALSVAGGLYLAWLGLSTLWRAIRSPRTLDLSTGRHDAASAFRQGLTATVLNPSIVTFYLTVVPGFLPATDAGAFFALLTAIHVSMAFVCHMGWAAAIDRLRTWLTQPGALRKLDAAAGVALLLLGLKIILRRPDL